ncbi:DNA-binding transcriptional regulator, AcrR family [Nakamurella panacisegetis]|uniref:DNA-binding transcriptional regulator, AcrR family n=1 Tax=Nakamurella panacisegetis TaxID=1090615 RepID=A0A1H0NLD0_9ACTN|nr:TetR/AcrR family transcriptional regulator [Nakamurella panacisegetis]SDO93235.1 DNA-binding transcriptional regulator, AcrR family [Nakamurella panacisegetis]
MPPEQRRAAIIDAALPLLRTHGADVTTKQIAERAGIAEGTLFRVFPDKEALLVAAVQQVFDPRPALLEMDRIDLTLPLRERMRAAVEIIARRLDSVWELMSALRMMGPPDQNPRFREALPPSHLNDLLQDALSRLLEPDRDQLRVESAQAARLLRLVTFACTHPRITDDSPLKPDEVVDLLLDGLLAHHPI